MAKLGSKKRPAIVRVQSPERAEELLSLCHQHGWQAIVGLDPDQPEDITDVERLLAPLVPASSERTTGRNDPCPCGSGKKFKKCCSERPAAQQA